MAITVTHKFVSAIPDAGDPTIVQPSNWNDTHELTGLGTMAEQDANNVVITGGTMTGVAISGYVPTTETISAGTGLTGGGDLSAPRTLAIANTGVSAASYGTASKTSTLAINAQGQVTSASQQDIAITNTQVSGLGTASTKDAGVALGVATLDAAGKVPLSEIPDSIIGALSYQGTWNASTNTPTLISSVGVKGYYYVVSVAGTTNLNGITDWQVGDWAVFDGLIWEKIDNTDGVTSVNGFTGAVVLTTTNIAEGTNLYYTDARSRAAISAGTGISYNSTTGVITNSSPSLGGDVVGPSSATDNAIARFDSTTGKLIQNSVVTVDDTGNIAGALTITDLNYLDFNTAYATTLGAGELGWDGNNTLGLGMAGGNVIQHIGEDTFIYVKASSAITKGELCMFTGAVGASSIITAAPATGVTSGQYIIGLAAESIALNGFGLLQVAGNLKGFDTSAFATGDILYYNSAVTGGLTATYPTSGPIVTVCAVTNSGSGGSGSAQIRPTVTQRITAGTGISVSQTGSGTTVTNTAPDQTVSITAGTGISVSGTYPNFTVANSGVTALTGTASQVTVSASTGSVTLSLPSTINVNTSGNAATVTNGVYTTGSYADPTWITSLAGSKITGTIDGGTF